MDFRTATTRWAVLSLLRRMREGRVDVSEEQAQHAFGPAAASLRTRLVVRSPRFWRALAGGSTPLADAYARRDWECDDLVTLVRIGARELRRVDRLRRPLAPLLERVSRLPRMTRAGSRRSVAAHYDMGNELFSLFLDESMTYSCAYFETPSASLADAQTAKLDRICAKLDLRPDDHLLEIGTGWGSLAMHAASCHGCRVTTTTISRRQREEAMRRVQAAGLADRVTVLFEDYRDLRGRFDKLVSVEMVEGVGWQYFDVFFRCCSELLTPQGLMLLQAIVIEDGAYEAEKATRSFITSRIFPGGCLPSRAVIDRCVRDATDMRVLAVEDLTEHYALTTRRWRESWNAKADLVAALGGDEAMRRMWDLYFAWCEGGFRERRIGDVQVLMAKPAFRIDRRANSPRQVAIAQLH